MVHSLLRLHRWEPALTHRVARRRAPALALLALVASLGAAGCFTSPINRPPVVTDVTPDTIRPRGFSVTFTAHGYDPDEDQLTWTWGVGAYPCPPDPHNRVTWPSMVASAPSPTRYELTSTATAACVWAFATDRYGAVDAANDGFVPSNNPPQPVIQVVQPEPAPTYPAYAKFRLSGALSTDADGDPLSYMWNLDQSPLGSTAGLVPCPDAPADDSLRCLAALLSGQYLVSLAVSDGFVTEKTSTTLIVQSDQLPAVAETVPDYRQALHTDDPTAPMPLEVRQVNDDGEPYPNPNDPTHTVQFTWFKAKNGGPFQYVDNGGSFPKLTLIPMDYELGDVADIRLEVHDRNTDAVDAILRQCGNQDLCPIAPGSTSYLRVTWHIRMIEAPRMIGTSLP